MDRPIVLKRLIDRCCSGGTLSSNMVGVIWYARSMPVTGRGSYKHRGSKIAMEDFNTVYRNLTSSVFQCAQCNGSYPLITSRSVMVYGAAGLMGQTLHVSTVYTNSLEAFKEKRDYCRERYDVYCETRCGDLFCTHCVSEMVPYQSSCSACGWVVTNVKGNRPLYDLIMQVGGEYKTVAQRESPTVNLPTVILPNLASTYMDHLTHVMFECSMCGDYCVYLHKIWGCLHLGASRFCKHLVCHQCLPTVQPKGCLMPDCAYNNQELGQCRYMTYMRHTDTALDEVEFWDDVREYEQYVTHKPVSLLKAGDENSVALVGVVRRQRPVARKEQSWREHSDI